jgi:hypothetical protein
MSDTMSIQQSEKNIEIQKPVDFKSTGLTHSAYRRLFCNPNLHSCTDQSKTRGHIMSKTVSFAVLGVIFLIVAARTGHAEMTVTITSITDGAYYEPCTDIPLTCEVTATGEVIRNVRYYANGYQIGWNRAEPWDDVWEQAISGNYEIWARVEDADRNRVYTADTLSVKIGGISAGDLIRNGSFDCGKISPWSLQNNEGAISRMEVLTDYWFDDSTYVYLEIENGSSADWHIQLNQPFPIDSGHTYEAWFWGDADEVKNITVAIQQGVDPWTTYLWEGVEIDGVNEYGPFVHEANVTDNTAVFKLCCGGNDIDCYFDAIRVLDKSITSVRSMDLSFANGVVAEYELYQNFPNPFNAQTELRYRLSAPAVVDLSIYNLQGQVIKKLAAGEKGQGIHHVSWDGSDFTNSQVPSGVYFCRFRAHTGERSIDLSRKLLMLR